MRLSAIFLLLILSAIVASDVLQTGPIQEAATQIYTGPYSSYSSYQVTISISGLPSQYSANIKVDGNGQGSIQGGSSGTFQVSNTQSHVFQADDYVSGPAGTRYACAESSWTLQQSQSSYNPYNYYSPYGGYGGYNSYYNYPYNYYNYPPFHSTITESTTITTSSESTTTTAATSTATGTSSETTEANVVTTTTAASSEMMTTTAASSTQAVTTQASTTQAATTQASTTQAATEAKNGKHEEDRVIVYPEDVSEDLALANYQQSSGNPVFQSPYGSFEDYSYYYPNYPYYPNYYPGYTGALQTASHTFPYVPEYSLTVENPTGASIDKAGWQQKDSVITLTTPDTIDKSNQEKDIFKGWNVDGSQVTGSTVTLTMNMPHTAKAMYQIQCYVDVRSGIGQPQGSGWYDQGSTATISVAPEVPMSGFWGALGGSYVFERWSRTSGSDLPNPTSTVTVDSPMTITAAWRPEYSTSTMILVIAIAAIAVVIILPIMLFRRGHGFRRESVGTALDSLNLRYSRGEITRREYLEKRKDIEGS
jgi:hypothetical protein